MMFRLKWTDSREREAIGEQIFTQVLPVGNIPSVVLLYMIMQAEYEMKKRKRKKTFEQVSSEHNASTYKVHDSEINNSWFIEIVQVFLQR